MENHSLKYFLSSYQGPLPTAAIFPMKLYTKGNLKQPIGLAQELEIFKFHGLCVKGMRGRLTSLLATGNHKPHTAGSTHCPLINSLISLIFLATLTVHSNSLLSQISLELTGHS